MKSGMNAGLGNKSNSLAEAGMSGGLDISKRKRRQGLEAGANAGLENAIGGQALAQAGLQGGIEDMKKGGKVSSASKRADGCAIKGKTKGKMV